MNSMEVRRRPRTVREAREERPHLRHHLSHAEIQIVGRPTLVNEIPKSCSVQYV